MTDPGWKWPLQFARQAGADVREIPIYDSTTKYRLIPQQLTEAVDHNTRIIIWSILIIRWVSHTRAER
jgi:histidinol-phosphate aminotransferase